MSHPVLSALAVLVFAAAAHAGPDDFGPGPLIDAYGRIAPVDVEMDIPVGTEF